jgi:hypothetical protein
MAPSPQSVEAHLVPRHNVGTAAREQETPISTDGRRSKHSYFCRRMKAAPGGKSEP